MATRGKSGPSAQGEHGANEAATNGNGAIPEHGDSPSPARGQGAATIAPRPAQFMIAPQQQPGLATFSIDFLTQQLTSSPDIEVVKTVPAPRLFGFQSADLGQVPLSPLVLAKMTPDKARVLQTQAGERCAVERDERLTYMLDPTTPQLPNPGVLTPLADGFTATIEVLGQDGPLPGAEVYVFGSMWPAQAITDATGRATVTLQGETPETIRSILVKPKIDYWTFWLDRPQLVPNNVNRIVVRALGAVLRSFPGQQLTGWGERAMGLDRVPPSFDGAGIKIAVIDSGLAPTHRNLRGITEGTSIVGNDKAAWTVDTIGHGSHCAGIIAGGPIGSGGGIRGFAPAAEIHVCRIFPGGRFSDLVSALDYCMEHGIDVANMSLGGGEPSRIIEERIVRAKERGMACIIAAGNSSGPVQFPASTPHCLAVAALGKWGEFPEDSYHAQQALDGFQSRDGYFPAKFSCFGPEIDVCAPGVAIVSSLPADGFGAWDGTSMATPHVTGLAALVLAHHPDFTKGSFQNRDARRVERLFQILKETATPLQFGDPNRAGAGLPNAMRALGLETGIAPVAAAASGTDPSLAALRRLLGLRPVEAPSMIPAGAMTPQSIGPMPNGSSHVARGPAQVANGIAPMMMDPDPAQIRQLMHKVGLL
ncbi:MULTISPECIES: S8 family serine peptidase [unclassified Bradyrhizobium]|uniref:S8 family serine peptidase n=1 Tax=unclassified Bradyrhizobium TaxID=2631580 RepID=UPI00211F1668|nr:MULTISPECIES: S8 family serine peptidase [unclassified Bradyrhizobium]MDD1535394.1 subtilisin [Bradyrhizobium sp. WBOS8]MDD1581923.1 subtilisin [Bradyrhizobium sp. WBOS4]UUO47489.1 subtilisin [Bradyrhizobium sp. WBOS04]UUO61105.1 subtilisin [Bradyrhizobium sp. WBOS08]